MKKLKLIIADTDRNYLEDLERYILRKHSQRFELQSFTELELLNGYLEQPGQPTDILLLSEEFREAAAAAGRQEIRICLSESGKADETGTEPRICKYQHVEAIVGELLTVYSERGGGPFAPAIRGEPQIIGLYSSAGGTGKTAIAVCASMLCSGRGLRVLYLNLETVSSTPDFFQGGSGRTFSSVIYYLKENSGSLSAKLEGARNVDPGSGVSFFSPPDSSRDMEELLYEDTELLFQTLKTAGYDIIFADLSAGFSDRNLAAFKACDGLIRVRDANSVHPGREELVQREFELLREKSGLNMEAKTIPVANRCKDGSRPEGGCTIGYYPEMEREGGCRCANWMEFTREVAFLLEHLPEGGGVPAGV